MKKTLKMIPMKLISNSEIDDTDTKSVNDYQLNRAIDLLKSISVYDNLKKAS